EAKLYALVVVGLLNSVISLYYYARVVKTMFLDLPAADDPAMRFTARELGAVGTLSLATVVLGVYCNWLLSWVEVAGKVYTGGGRRPVAAGTLYVVATPIGNLEDVTLRALRVLHEVDLIAAEDTRRTRTLLARHGIARPLTSYYDAVERERAPALVERLK